MNAYGDDYSRKPSFRAVQSLATLFADGVQTSDSGWMLFQRDEAFAPGRIRYRLFRKDAIPLWAFWDSMSVFADAPAERYDVQYSLGHSGLRLREPVLIDPLMQDGNPSTE